MPIPIEEVQHRLALGRSIRNTEPHQTPVKGQRPAIGGQASWAKSRAYLFSVEQKDGRS